MADRAPEIARALVENEIAFDDLAELPALIRARWPGVERAEIERAVRIAVECVLMDGRPRAARVEG